VARETLLSTGEVAALIGSSRQHVVDLCDRGELRCVRLGAHRRIDRAEVERHLSARGADVDVSHGVQLWLCRAQAGRLATNWARARSAARRQIGEWRRDANTRFYADQWARIIEMGAEASMQVLTARDVEAFGLQKMSPFESLVSTTERNRIVEQFLGEWSRGRAIAT
jgi:excisionase family DNA binding protein